MAPLPSAPVHTWSATTIARAIGERRISAREVTRAVLDRMAVIDPQVIAFAATDPDQALAAAAAIDQRLDRGEVVGPLAGVPFSVKDLIATHDLETAFGSHAMDGNRPARDAVAVARLRAAGGVLIGKTTTPEFGHKALTSSPRHGHTRNPWHLDYSPGGSSGGSTVAVATGMAPLSLTTDGSGSARIPASACGVLGLKPTLGLIPHELAAELFNNFVTLGLASRTTADLALGLQATVGMHPTDPWSRGPTPPDYAAGLAAIPSLQGLRVLVIERMGNAHVDAAVLAAVDRVAGQLARAGASVTRWPASVDNGRLTLVTMMRAYQNVRLRPLLANHRDRLDPTLVAALAEGAEQTLADLQRAPADRSALLRTVEGWLGEHDLLLTPTLATPPLAVDHRQDEPLVVNGRAVGSIREAWYCYTGLFNLTGHPGLNVPAGFTSDGLPLGVQLVGHWHDEARLLQVAALLEAENGWPCEWPPEQPASGPAPRGRGGVLPYPSERALTGPRS